jgi:hypothetical protein
MYLLRTKTAVTTVVVEVEAMAPGPRAVVVTEAATVVGMQGQLVAA